MKIAICNELFENWSLDKIFSYISKLGYKGIEIAPFTITDDVRKVGRAKRSEIRELASSYGLEVVGTHWLLVTPKGLHITHPDESIRKSTKQYLCELVRFTSEIGGRLLVFGSPNQRNLLSDVSKEEAWNYAKEVFFECSRFAEDHGAVIAIEPLSRRITNFIDTAEEALRLIREVSHPNFKLHLDVFSMLDEGKPLPEIIRSGKEHLVHLHINDDNGLGPGFGKVDYQPIIKALKDIDYQGFLSVEVFDFSPGPERIATMSIQTINKVLRDG